MSAAAVILEQLGGGRFLAMTGAVCLDCGDALQIKLPRISKLSAVRIALDPATDTYTLQGYRGRGVKIAPAGAPEAGIYADSLRRFFTAATGLEVSL
jgi:hypothetical protein